MEIKRNYRNKLFSGLFILLGIIGYVYGYSTGMRVIEIEKTNKTLNESIIKKELEIENLKISLDSISQVVNSVDAAEHYIK